MDLRVSDLHDPRQATVVKDLARLQAEKGAVPGDRGHVTESTLLLLLEFYQEKRIRTGVPSMGSIKSYLSAIKAIHTSSGIDWRLVRESFLVLDKLKKMAASPEVENKVRRQDYAITLLDLERFCDSLDPDVHADLVAGALATLLFWALGRVHELLHAERYRRMRLDSVEEAENQLSKRRTFRVFIERPKVKRAGEMQFLCPLRYLGKANPQLWMTMLLFSISELNFEVSSPWEISEGVHADSKWLYAKIYPILGPMNQRLGSSSFRAGGYTHMAWMGYELTLLRLFGRWSSDANDTYLRECPHILASSFAAKSRGISILLPADAGVGPVAGSIWGRPAALGIGPLIKMRPLRALLPASETQSALLPRKRHRCDSGSRRQVDDLDLRSEAREKLGSKLRKELEPKLGSRKDPWSRVETGDTKSVEVVKKATFPQSSNSYLVSSGMTLPQSSNSYLSIPRRHDYIPEPRYFSS
jgi:hypothetical protein